MCKQLIQVCGHPQAQAMAYLQHADLEHCLLPHPQSLLHVLGHLIAEKYWQAAARYINAMLVIAWHGSEMEVRQVQC